MRDSDTVIDSLRSGMFVVCDHVVGGKCLARVAEYDTGSPCCRVVVYRNVKGIARCTSSTFIVDVNEKIKILPPNCIRAVKNKKEFRVLQDISHLLKQTPSTPNGVARSPLHIRTSITPLGAEMVDLTADDSDSPIVVSVSSNSDCAETYRPKSVPSIQDTEQLSARHSSCQKDISLESVITGDDSDSGRSSEWETEFHLGWGGDEPSHFTETTTVSCSSNITSHHEKNSSPSVDNTHPVSPPGSPEFQQSRPVDRTAIANFPENSVAIMLSHAREEPFDMTSLPRQFTRKRVRSRCDIDASVHIKRDALQRDPDKSDTVRSRSTSKRRRKETKRFGERQSPLAKMSRPASGVRPIEVESTHVLAMRETLTEPCRGREFVEPPKSYGSASKNKFPGVIGVSGHSKRYRAVIEYRGQRMEVPGIFDSDVEAALARDEFGMRVVGRSFETCFHVNTAGPPLYGYGKKDGEVAVKHTALKPKIKSEKQKVNSKHKTSAPCPAESGPFSSTWWWDNLVLDKMVVNTRESSSNIS